MNKTISVAVLVIAVAAALVLTISYAWGMACPSTRGDYFTLRIESVTVDGVLQEDLGDYYSPDFLDVTLRADIDRSTIKADKNTVISDHVALRFRSRVDNYGSYDEIFRIDTGNP